MIFNSEFRKKLISIYTIFFIVAAGMIGFFTVESIVDESGSVVAAKTFIVDVNGGGNYTTIQTAINAANDGDSIRVWAGTYNENVIVNKTLNIIGNLTANTFINGGGGGDVIQITADRVNISGFTITNGGTQFSPNYDAGIELNNVSNCVILDNNISNNGQLGIRFFQSNNNSIINNNINSNLRDGLLISISNNLTFVNNNISSNSYYGITSAYGDKIKLINNSIMNNKRGLFVSAYSSFNIINSTILNSIADVRLYWHSNATLLNCNYNNNKIEFVDSTNNLTNQWYLSIQVIDIYSNPIKNANIKIKNSKNKLIFSGNTNESGFVKSINCTEFVNSSTSTTYHTPHMININYNSRNFFNTSFMNKSKVIIIKINPNRVYNIDKNTSYSKIQDAIDNASAGDTIRVWAGIYYENVVVNKTVTLIGNGSENTTIDGGRFGVVVKITANNVTLSGFNITNSGTNWNDAGIELNTVTNCNIFNNSCSSNNRHGTYLVYSSYNNIVKNTINSNNEDGFILFYSSNNKISNNSCSNNHEGILLGYSFNNTITNNNCNANEWYSLYIIDSSNNTFINNSCNSNNHDGIHLSYSSNNSFINNTCKSNKQEGIFLDYSSNNTFKNNSCDSNNLYGIVLYFSPNNSFFNNSMVSCGLFIFGDELQYWDSHIIESNNLVNGKPLLYLKNLNGSVLSTSVGQIILVNCTNLKVEAQILDNCSCGILLGYSSNNEIRNNTISFNEYGIYLFSSSNNSLSNNSCDLNNQDGIYLWSFSNYNNIINNTCNSNNLYGIHLYSFSNNNIIRDNTCNSNTIDGIHLYGHSNNNLINNNYCSDNWDGISIGGSSSNKITNNICNSNNIRSISFSNSWYNNVNNNTFNTNNKGGIFLHLSSKNTIVNNTIMDNNYGIKLIDSSSNIFNNNYIINTTIGVNITSSSTNNFLINTSIINSTIFDIQFNSDSHISALNCTLNWSNIHYIDSLSNLTVQWYLNVKVINSTNESISDANILIKDKSKKLTFIGKTNHEGFNKWIICDQYVENSNGIVTQFSPYNITVNKTSFEVGYANPEPVINSSKTITIVIDQDITPPTSPTSLIFSAKGGTFNNLTWTASPSTDVQGYEIYVNNTNSITQFHHLANTTNTYYNHTGLAQETTFLYKVRAFDEVPLFSLFSNTISTKTLDITPPDPPTSLILNNLGGTFIHLTWTGSSSVDLQGYEIFINDTSSSSSYHLLTTVTTTNYNHTGVLEKTRYYYKVRAFDEVPLYSSFSNTISVKTLDITPPNQPTGLNVIDVYGHAVKLTWNANLETDLNGYSIFINDTNAGSGGPYIKKVSVISSATEYTITGLVEETIYYIKIGAYDFVPNQSPLSEFVTAKTLDVTAPEPPKNLTATPLSGTEVKLSWEANSEPDLEGYNIYINNTYPNLTFRLYDTVSKTTTSYIVNNLVENTYYDFYITSFDEVPNESYDSNNVRVETLDETPPSTPKDLKVVETTPNSLTLTWKYNTEKDIAQYTIFKSELPNGTFSEINILRYQNRFEDSNLKEGSTYYYYILAIDYFGWRSKPSEIVTGTTGYHPRKPQINNTISDFEILEDGFDDFSINLYYWFKDLNGDILTFRVKGDKHIDVTIDQQTGSVTLTPKENWNGFETLTFNANDQISGEVSDSVNVTIKPVNDPPGAVEIKSPIIDIELKEGQANYFEAACSDPDIIYGDILTYTWTSNISGEVGKGETIEDINLTLGMHLITVNVTDQAGEFSVAAVRVKINELPLQDEDNDNLPDAWEIKWFDKIDKFDGSDDPDKDGITNYHEYLNDTDPTIPEQETKSEEPEEDNTTLMIAFMLVPIIFFIIILFFFIFLKKKKGGGKTPETIPLESMNHYPPTYPSTQQPPQEPPKNEFLNYNTQDQNGFKKY